MYLTTTPETIDEDEKHSIVMDVETSGQLGELRLFSAGPEFSTPSPILITRGDISEVHKQGHMTTGHSVET